MLALLLAGCGSGESRSAATRSATSSATASTSTSRSLRSHPGGEALPTKAQALSYIRAVNLRLSDLPAGYEVEPRKEEHEGPAEKALSHQFLRCLVGGAGQGVGGAHSKENIAKGDANYQRKGRSLAAMHVGSSVSVVPSAAVAVQEMQLLNRGQASACFGEFMRRVFGRAAPKLHIGKVTASTVAPSGKGSFGLKLVAQIHYNGVKIPFYFGMYGFASGRAEVMLTIFSMFAPMPAEAVHRLYALLQQRAAANSL